MTIHLLNPLSKNDHDGFHTPSAIPKTDTSQDGGHPDANLYDVVQNEENDALPTVHQLRTRLREERQLRLQLETELENAREKTLNLPSDQNVSACTPVTSAASSEGTINAFDVDQRKKTVVKTERGTNINVFMSKDAPFPTETLGSEKKRPIESPITRTAHQDELAPPLFKPDYQNDIIAPALIKPGYQNNMEGATMGKTKGYHSDLPNAQLQNFDDLLGKYFDLAAKLGITERDLLEQRSKYEKLEVDYQKLVTASCKVSCGFETLQRSSDRQISHLKNRNAFQDGFVKSLTANWASNAQQPQLYESSVPMLEKDKFEHVRDHMHAHLAHIRADIEKDRAITDSPMYWKVRECEKVFSPQVWYEFVDEKFMEAWNRYPKM